MRFWKRKRHTDELYDFLCLHGLPEKQMKKKSYDELTESPEAQ